MNSQIFIEQKTAKQEYKDNKKDKTTQYSANKETKEKHIKIEPIKLSKEEVKDRDVRRSKDRVQE